MPWKEVSMKEARLTFVLAAKNPQTPLNFKDLCNSYNISTKTGYKWLNRYQEKGERGLDDLCRAPKNQPKKIDSEVEQCIIQIRKEYPRCGPKKIRKFMQNDFNHLKTPSEGSIGNILQKHHLSNPRCYRRHVARTAPLGECLNPNDVWCYDFKGWFLTKDGKKCEPLTITDAYSRYLLSLEHMERKRGEDVWKELEKVFLEYGLPHKIRSDNGPPFACMGVGRLSKLAIKLIKVGVIPEWITPGCPQENGRHERFHLTLSQETAKPPALTLSLQKVKFEQFKDYYNHKRPHEAISQLVPAKVYKASNRVWDGKFKGPQYSEDFELRKVEKGGHITWKGLHFFISENLKGEYVGIKEIAGDIMEIYYGPILLGKIDLTKGFKRL